MRLGVIVALALAACTGVTQRFPDDVQAALAHSPMRRLETAHFIIYYPAPRRAEVDRFLAHAGRCADLLRGHAQIHDGEWADKMVIVMPDVAFNNAYVLEALAGYEEVAVIPLRATLDFATEFGIPPDPGYVACHELTHYVHFQQLAGFWGKVDWAFGDIYTPQFGYDPWFLEGLATHYESALQPGVGRPHWPIFTGMFAAAYAGQHVGGGDLSSLARLSSVGHHYLVGAMFFRFLTERYGEAPLWSAIADQAHAITGWFFPGTFKTGFGVPFGDLLDQFDAWTHRTFPVRTPPATQRRLDVVGNDARYARGRDGTEAWVADDVDLPSRLIVRDASGRELLNRSLVEVVPPRKLVVADPLLVSGLSITADGSEVWLTVIDAGATFQLARTLRWRRGGELEQVADDLGPGATISPRGDIYYYCWVDGDSWSLAAYDVASHKRRFVTEAPPGTYVLGAQVSPDGTRIVANVWDGHAFVAWELDSVTGAHLRTIGGVPQSPIYDASFTSDGRLMYLATVADRFQVFIDGAQATDAPYAVLDAREAAGTIRFLDREGWNWELAEAPSPPPAAPLSASPPLPLSPPPPPPSILSDSSFTAFDHFFFPQERLPALLVTGNTALYGLIVAGGDRLGLQRWSIGGFLQDGAHYGGNFAYLNTMLAPVSVLAEGSLVDWSDPQPDKTTVERRTRDASAGAAYLYRNSLFATLAATYTDDYTPVRRLHLGGPQLALSWHSSETTRYTGDRRALIASAQTTFYPQMASTFAGDITDVGGSLGAVVPLPFGRRHTLYANVRGRALIAPSDTGLLQVGGDSGLAELYSHSSISETPPAFDDSRFPPNLRFVEPLRGYEDYAITTDRAELADISWRYPIIIDRGVAATFRYAPPSFLSEVDLELFGAGALDRANDRHVAAGGAITLRFQLLRISLALTYQVARRLVDDRALTQLVGVGPGP
jgi:hypothetical protein